MKIMVGDITISEWQPNGTARLNDAHFDASNAQATILAMSDADVVHLYNMCNLMAEFVAGDPRVAAAIAKHRAQAA